MGRSRPSAALRAGEFSSTSTTPIRSWSMAPRSACKWSDWAGRSPRTGWKSRSKRREFFLLPDRLRIEETDMRLLSADELETALRDIGARRYHRLHPFHALLHGGRCTRGQVQAWALNRYYYQAMIPVKDASLIARCDDSTLRREWRRRLVDHDGETAGDGGIARWLKLTDGPGLGRDYVVSLAGLL